MSTICKDCGVQGKGVHHCEQYYNQTHSIAEYQRIEEELQAKVEKLETERNLAWDKGYAQGRDDAHETIVALQAKVEELTASKYDDLMNDAYSRGWVDALAEAHGWNNPTTVLEDE